MAKIRIGNSFNQYLAPYFLVLGVGILLTSLSLLLSCATGKTEPLQYHHISYEGGHGSAGPTSTGIGGKGNGGSAGQSPKGGSGGALFETGSGGSSGEGDELPREDSGASNQNCIGEVEIHLVYQGPVWDGTNSLQAWWIPPGLSPREWGPVDECVDAQPNDGKLDCSFSVPHCTESFEFQINLPYGRFWGDMSCSPNGGCGQTLGTVSLDIQGMDLAYKLQSNGIKDVNCNSGCDPYPYKNGLVDFVP